MIKFYYSPITGLVSWKIAHPINSYSKKRKRDREYEKNIN